MKTKLTFLLTAIAFASISSIATAGPDMDQLALRKKIADSQRIGTVVRDSNYQVTYTPSPSGKGGVVARRSASQPVNNIAVFKSGKKEGCCPKC